MDFKLYKRPKISIDGQQTTSVIRLLFLVSLFLIVGLSLSYNKVNRELIYYSDRVDNIQQILVTLTELSGTLHKINYNTLSYVTRRNTDHRRRAEDAVNTLPGYLSRLDTLVIASDPQAYLAKVLRKRISGMYNLSDTLASDIRSRLPRPGVEEIVAVQNLINEMNRITLQLMESRMQSRDNYKSQIFRYNWVFMLVTIVFMAGTFYLLDRELLRNRKYRIELENKVENLNRSNSELEQFAYSASHDLQEPLRKIRSFADRIYTRHQAEISPEVGVLLERVSGSAERMQQLIKDLLAYSQLVRAPAPRQDVSLNRVLKEVLSNLSVTIREKNAVISSDDLPRIRAYYSQMIQLFQNLIGNSLKYSKPGVPPAIGVAYQLVKGSEIENSMPAHKSLNFHALVFTDNGIGFSDEYAEKIFGMFQRLHGREQFEGTGIGLAICRRVVSNHNGYIIARGIRDLGASFTIYLPVEDSGINT